MHSTHVSTANSVNDQSSRNSCHISACLRLLPLYLPLSTLTGVAIGSVVMLMESTVSNERGNGDVKASAPHRLLDTRRGCILAALDSSRLLIAETPSRSEARNGDVEMVLFHLSLRKIIARARKLCKRKDRQKQTSVRQHQIHVCQVQHATLTFPRSVHFWKCCQLVR